MSEEHTHLTGIDVSKDGAIHFQFTPHEDHHTHGITGLEVPAGHDAQRVAQQLQMLAALGAMHHDHAQATAQHIGADNVNALYDPGKPKEPPKAEGLQEVGMHTERYLNSASTPQGRSV